MKYKIQRAIKVSKRPRSKIHNIIEDKLLYTKRIFDGNLYATFAVTPDQFRIAQVGVCFWWIKIFQNKISLPNLPNHAKLPDAFITF